VEFDKPRPLTEIEKQILVALLDPDFPGVGELRSRLPHTMVVGGCDCGCPTVYLAISSDVDRSSVRGIGRLAPVEARIAPVDQEPPGEILLFVDDSGLNSLEYVSYADRPPGAWPSLDRLTVVVRTDRAADAGPS
jgi:hypothetical protein